MTQSEGQLKKICLPISRLNVLQEINQQREQDGERERRLRKREKRGKERKREG